MAKAVIFDLDGVLVDSEELFSRKLAAFVNGLGHAITWQEILRLTGSDSKQVMERLEKNNAIHLEGMQQKIVELIIQTEEEARLNDGALESLKAIKQNFPLALASNSPRAAVMRALETKALDKFFDKDRIVCREDVGEAKPSPEPYLKACSLLGLPPAQCVAIEDSEPGIASAKAAGCKVIAYLPQAGGGKNPLADVTVDNLAKITPELVAKL